MNPECKRKIGFINQLYKELGIYPKTLVYHTRLVVHIVMLLLQEMHSSVKSRNQGANLSINQNLQDS